MLRISKFGKENLLKITGLWNPPCPPFSKGAKGGFLESLVTMNNIFQERWPVFACGYAALYY
jgi:hypothetical protein